MERETGRIVAGVDEAGRGPLAGPVVAAAVILDETRLPQGLNDSKLIPKARHPRIFEDIMISAQIGIGIASVEEIDSLNILRASLLAMQRAVRELPSRPELALVDGNQLPLLDCEGKTLIGGDGICASIAAASIIAKVTRDRIMADLHKTFPDYGWDTNAGYGTAQHRKALEVVGVSPHHRRSFHPIRELLTQESLIKD